MPTSTITRPASTTPSIIGYESGNDHRALSDKEVNVHGKHNTLPSAEAGYDESMVVADELKARWDAKNKAKGQTRWYSPFDPREHRKLYKTKKACVAYMNKHQANQVELAKVEGRSVEPVKHLVSPKRTIEDFLAPGAASAQQAAADVARGMSGLVEHTVSGRGSKTGRSRVAKIMAQPEALAVQSIGSLDDDELQRCNRDAANRGKRKLANACRKALKARGIKIDWRA